MNPVFNKISGFQMVDIFCTEKSAHAGALINVGNCINFVVIDLKRFGQEGHCEIIEIIIRKLSNIAVAFYHLSSGDFKAFLKVTDGALNSIFKYNFKKLLKFFKNYLCRHEFKCKIWQPESKQIS